MGQGRGAAMAKRKKRVFSEEYRAEVVKLIRESGRSIASICRELDLPESAVGRWVARARQQEGLDPAALTNAERDELKRLRAHVKQLEMEREILKKAAAFFARENS